MFNLQTFCFISHPFGNTYSFTILGLNDKILPKPANNFNRLAVERVIIIINFYKLNFMGILHPSRPGCACRIWPLTSWAGWPAFCQTIGTASTVTRSIIWKPLWTKPVLPAPATKRPTGSTWATPPAGVKTIKPTNRTVRSKPCGATR